MFAIWMCKLPVMPSRVDGEGPLSYSTCHSSQEKRQAANDLVHPKAQDAINAFARSLAVCAARDNSSYARP